VLIAGVIIALMPISHLIDVTPEALVEKYGTNAPRIVNIMIEDAIAKRCPDQALQLDRVRRLVEKKAGSATKRRLASQRSTFVDRI
jgi:hypothetical protein